MSGPHTRTRAALREAGLELPQAPTAVGAYVPARVSGGLVFTSGQLPMVEGALMSSGIVDRDVTREVAIACAERCALNALAAASTVCDLDEVAAVVRLTGYVASGDGFRAQPTIVDGASRVLLAAFGAENGAHARVAVGVAELPLGAPVEVELVLALG